MIITMRMFYNDIWVNNHTTEICCDLEHFFHLKPLQFKRKFYAVDKYLFTKEN